MYLYVSADTVNRCYSKFNTRTYCTLDNHQTGSRVSRLRDRIGQITCCTSTRVFLCGVYSTLTCCTLTGVSVQVQDIRMLYEYRTHKYILIHVLVNTCSYRMNSVLVLVHTLSVLVSFSSSFQMPHLNHFSNRIVQSKTSIEPVPSQKRFHQYVRTYPSSTNSSLLIRLCRQIRQDLVRWTIETVVVWNSGNPQSLKEPRPNCVWAPPSMSRFVPWN